MILKKITVVNFASYPYLEYEFKQNETYIIYGPTGSGKSTFCDLVPWTLFGKTAKGGTVDEILSWYSDEVTKAILSLEHNGTIEITRIRGKKPKDNDLFFTKKGVTYRGKDIQDTQKQLNALLGIDINIYLAMGYCHDHSLTSSFFITSAKQRKQLIDQLIDTSFLSRLHENAALYKKELKLEFEQIKQLIDHKTTRLQHVVADIDEANYQISVWQETLTKEKLKLKNLAASFEESKLQAIEDATYNHLLQKTNLEADIQDLKKDIKPSEFYITELKKIQDKKQTAKDNCCQSCGAPLSFKDQVILDKRENELKTSVYKNTQALNTIAILEVRLQNHCLPTSHSSRLIQKEIQAENTYAKQLVAIKEKQNPFLASLDRKTKEEKELKKDIKIKELELKELQAELVDLNNLQDALIEAKDHNIASGIEFLQDKTNIFLTQFFDAEIQVNFKVTQDDLDLEITKNGFHCSFQQLSKGQKCILKLCFSSAVVEHLSNLNDIDINTLYFDEMLDGCDQALKLKAVSLFNYLALHKQVLIVEHSTELQTMVSNQIKVSITNAGSTIENA